MKKETFKIGDIVTIKGDTISPSQRFIVNDVSDDRIGLIYSDSNNYINTTGYYSSILFTKNELKYKKRNKFNKPPQKGDIVSLKTNDTYLYVVSDVNVNGDKICVMRFDYIKQEIYQTGWMNYNCFNKWDIV